MSDTQAKAGERAGACNTLIDAIQSGAESDRSICFADSNRQSVTWGRLVADGIRGAGVLDQLGFGPGARAALVGPTSLETVKAIEAIFLAGCALVVLPPPRTRTSTSAIVREWRERIRSIKIDCFIVHPAFSELGDQVADMTTVIRMDRLNEEALRTRIRSAANVSPTMPAVIQFTSGTTGEPRAAIITHENVISSMGATVEAMGHDAASDSMLSWLPLFHDMGLFGFLVLPMITGTSLVIADPQAFVADPSVWMRWMSHFKASTTAGPSFAYAIAARCFRRSSSDLDLSSCKWLGNGSEPVDYRIVQSFCSAAAACGLNPKAVCAGYGLAEATLAVSLAARSSGLKVDTVEQDSLSLNKEARPTGVRGKEPTSTFAVLGTPIGGMEVAIFSPNGVAQDDRSVGEVAVRGRSVSAGYLDEGQGTTATLRDGWFHTGDLGYTIAGELVICGRSKDIIIVGGRSVTAQDVERIVAALPDIGPGKVAAFAVPDNRGRERIGIVIEHDPYNRGQLTRAVRLAIIKHFAARPALIDVWDLGSLPRTTSGKLRRSEVRRQAMAYAGVSESSGLRVSD